MRYPSSSLFGKASGATWKKAVRTLPVSKNLENKNKNKKKQITLTATTKQIKNEK